MNLERLNISQELQAGIERLARAVAVTQAKLGSARVKAEFPAHTIFGRLTGRIVNNYMLEILGEDGKRYVAPHEKIIAAG